MGRRVVMEQLGCVGLPSLRSACARAARRTFPALWSLPLAITRPQDPSPTPAPTPAGVEWLEGLQLILGPAVPGALALDVDLHGDTWVLEAGDPARLVRFGNAGPEERLDLPLAANSTRGAGLLVLEDGLWVVAEGVLVHVPRQATDQDRPRRVEGPSGGSRDLTLDPRGTLLLLDEGSVLRAHPELGWSYVGNCRAADADPDGLDPRTLVTDSYGGTRVVTTGEHGEPTVLEPYAGTGTAHGRGLVPSAVPAPCGSALFEAGRDDPLAALDGAVLLADPRGDRLLALVPRRQGAGWRHDPVVLLSGAGCHPRDVQVDAAGELRLLLEVEGVVHLARLAASGVEPLPPLELEGLTDTPEERRARWLDGLACAHPGTRAAAASRLSSLPVEEEREALRVFTAHPRPRVAARALWRLAELEGGPEFVRQFLHRDVPELRAVALRALQRAGTLELADLALGVEDEDPLVRAATAPGLAQLDPTLGAPLRLALARATEPEDPNALAALREAAGLESGALRDLLEAEGLDARALLGDPPAPAPAPPTGEARDEGDNP